MLFQLFSGQVWLFAFEWGRLRKAKAYTENPPVGLRYIAQVLGRASVDKPKIWYPEVREAAEVVYKVRMHKVIQVFHVTASRMFSRETLNYR